MTVYSNFSAGTTTDAPLLIGATTVNSAEFATLPEVASPDTMWLVLDPEGASGAPEIVQVTAHVAAATACTIVRAQQSTVAREHAAATAWRVALTKADADQWDSSGRGVMGYAEATVNQAIAAPSTVDITGVTVTFTAVAGRRYRATIRQGTFSAGGDVGLLREGSSTLLSTAFDYDAYVTNSSISGSKTWKLSVTTTDAGTYQASATYPAYILVEDIGAL